MEVYGTIATFDYRVALHPLVNHGFPPQKNAEEFSKQPPSSRGHELGKLLLLQSFLVTSQEARFEPFMKGRRCIVDDP